MIEIAPARLVVFDGASHNVTPTGAAYPAKVMVNFTRALAPVVARSATGWNIRAEDAARRVDAHLASVTGSSWLVDCGGSFEVQADLVGADILTRAESYWNGRLAAGFDFIVACTTLPSTGYSPTQDDEREAFNDLVRSSLVPTAVADLAATPALLDPADTAIYSDGLHLTEAGADAAEQVITAALLAAGITP